MLTKKDRELTGVVGIHGPGPLGFPSGRSCCAKLKTFEQAVVVHIADQKATKEGDFQAEEQGKDQDQDHWVVLRLDQNWEAAKPSKKLNEERDLRS